MSLSDVSNILWRERQRLELLVFKIEEEQFVLASGRTRWLSHATREVEAILEEIKRVELERAVALSGDAHDFGMSDAPTLRELAAMAPPPWNGIFAEHRRELLLLAQEIDSITKSNRDMLQRGRQAARAALVSFDDLDQGPEFEGLSIVSSPPQTPPRAENMRPQSVRSLDEARNSKAGVNSDEEVTHIFEYRTQVLMDLQAQETTYQAALSAAANTIQPSLAAFLQ